MDRWLTPVRIGFLSDNILLMNPKLPKYGISTILNLLRSVDHILFSLKSIGMNCPKIIRWVSLTVALSLKILIYSVLLQ